MNLEPQHVCHSGCPKHILRWNSDKALHYAEHFGNNIEGHSSFMKAIERKDVEAANKYLRAMIISAACTSGMNWAISKSYYLCMLHSPQPQVLASSKAYHNPLNLYVFYMIVAFNLRRSPLGGYAAKCKACAKIPFLRAWGLKLSTSASMPNVAEVFALRILSEESKGGSWSQKGSLVWWCMQEKEKWFLRSLRDGREDLQDTKKEYRKHTWRVARKFSKQQTDISLDKLSKRDPAIYDMLKQRKTNLSIPCAYRCLEYLPPFTCQC